MEKKKSLGQHFLRSAHYLKLVADTAAIVPGERVLEIGPGEGALTKEILARGARVVAVEKDRRLIPVLEETFSEEIAAHALKIVEDDALRINTSQYFEGEPYKLAANIPYYITGALLEKFLSAEHQPTSMTLLVQKEVAERIAREKKESILSLSVKAYGEPRYIKTVPAGAFGPPPEVDSAILFIGNISRKHFSSRKQEQKFFELVRAGFAHKRKLLLRNLESVLGQKSPEALNRAGIVPSARAEDVALEQWLTLADSEN